MRWIPILALLCWIQPAAAASYDLIYPDSLDVTLNGGYCVGSLTMAGFGILVNTGSTPIPADTVSRARFSAVSSVPGISLLLGSGIAPLSLLNPEHAFGAIDSTNTILLSRLQPGEVLETSPWYWTFLICPDPKITYEGPVRFDCVMHMANQRVTFTMRAMVHRGWSPIRYISAGRASAQPEPVLVLPMEVMADGCPKVVESTAEVIPLAILLPDSLPWYVISIPSLTLQGFLRPSQWRPQDVGTPLPTLDPCGCPPAVGDGRWDLTLWFSSVLVFSTFGFGDPHGGHVLTLSGMTVYGVPFTASACLTVTDPYGITGFSLGPNPCRAQTWISYGLSGWSPVRLRVYDVAGRLVESLVSQTQSPGVHTLTWAPKGRPSGLYVLRLDAGGQTETRHLMVVQ